MERIIKSKNITRVIPKFFSYSLTPEEEGICAKVGYLRQLPMLGQPERNRNYSEGDIWEVWQHSICAGAELAFAKMLGIEDFVPHVNKFKTAEDVPGYEVRYSFGNQKLRFSEWDNKDAIYVLLVEGISRKTRRLAANGWLGSPYRAICWADGHHIMNHGQKLGNSWTIGRMEAFAMEQLKNN